MLQPKAATPKRMDRVLGKTSSIQRGNRQNKDGDVSDTDLRRPPQLSFLFALQPLHSSFRMVSLEADAIWTGTTGAQCRKAGTRACHQSRTPRSVLPAQNLLLTRNTTLHALLIALANHRSVPRRRTICSWINDLLFSTLRRLRAKFQ